MSTGGHNRDWIFPGLIVLAAAGAYSGAFGGPFMFDDLGSILDNPTIHHLWTGLCPPPGATVSGRPVLNLSLALNYAVDGANVRGYHAMNLAIHMMAGLALFGILRRTLAKIGSARPAQLAFAAALLWTVNPLQTESVTYVIQRAESLMGLFYLLTLYCFIRSIEIDAEQVERLVPRRFSDPPDLRMSKRLGTSRSTCFCVLSILSCALGMATKEVMVTAPLVVLLYDRTFVSGSFRAAWRSRKGYYAGLASTWLLLAVLVVSTHGRGGTAGFGAGVTWPAYALTQFRAIVHYFRLALWPHPLISDYGRSLGGPPLQIAADAAFLLALAGASAFLLFRRGGRAAALGFAGAWFFLILAPSSSVIPVATEIMAEHRMYLPLAAVTVVEVWALDAAIARIVRNAGSVWGWLRPSLCLILATVFLLLTLRRNQDYASPPVSIWRDQVIKSPRDASARFALGQSLLQVGDTAEAQAEFEKALAIKPDYPEALLNLGNILLKNGSAHEAIADYRAALSVKPDYADACFDLAVALDGDGQIPEAISCYRRGLQLQPDNALGHAHLASALAATGQLPEAIAEYEESARLKPGYPEVQYNLGTALAQAGRLPEAIAHFQQAVALQPGYAEAHADLGIAFAQGGRLTDAIAEFKQALRYDPRNAQIQYDLGMILQQAGRGDEAKAHLDEAARLGHPFP